MADDNKTAEQEEIEDWSQVESQPHNAEHNPTGTTLIASDSNPNS